MVISSRRKKSADGTTFFEPTMAASCGAVSHPLQIDGLPNMATQRASILSDRRTEPYRQNETCHALRSKPGSVPQIRRQATPLSAPCPNALNGVVNGWLLTTLAPNAHRQTQRSPSCETSTTK